jgi:hypothetical protein
LTRQWALGETRVSIREVALEGSFNPNQNSGGKVIGKMMDEDRLSGGESRADKVKRQAEEKRKRLAESLRANLLRRKTQSRARAETPDPLADDFGRDKEEGAGPTE